MLMEYYQGPFGVLSSTQHVPLHGGIDRARRPHLLGRLLNCLDRGSGRHGTDQASRRQHVSSSHFVLPAVANLHLQLIPAVCLHHRIHSIPACHRSSSQCAGASLHRSYPCLHCASGMVVSSWRQHIGWIWCDQESGRSGSIPIACVLCWPRLPVFY